VIRDSELDDAREYWTVYSMAVAAIKRALLHRTSPKLRETSSPNRNSPRTSTERNSPYSLRVVSRPQLGM
jgi:hypothetical protein